MGVRAIGRAFDLVIRSSTDKFVLVALADNANDTGIAYPSVSTICQKTSLNRKTVIAALDRLTAAGTIEDTGKRVGQTKQVKVYRITWADETVPKAEQFQISPKESQIYLENHQEPSVPSSPENQHIQRMLTNAKTRPAGEAHVVSFCLGLGLPKEDGEYFWNHWSSNGFKNNGKAMVDWQCTVRAWKHAGHCPSQKQQRGNGATGTKPMSTFEITTKIKAIEDELGKTEYDKDKPAVAAKRRELWAKRKALKAKLLE